MSMKGFACRQRGISGVLIMAFLVTLADIPAFAHPGTDTPIRITNQEVRVEGGVAFISYDLEAPEGASYNVTVELRRENDPSFGLVPSNATGDVGEVKSPGPGKLIRWEFLKDFPIGLRGEDYYFRIEATRSGGFPWLWVALGSAALAGGVVAIVGGKSPAAPAQPGTQELPLPPAR